MILSFQQRPEDELCFIMCISECLICVRNSQVCEHTENISEKNTQMIQSADTNTHEENTEIHKHKKKKKKRKAEVADDYFAHIYI